MERNAAGVMLMFMRWLLWIKTLVDPRPFRSSHVRGHISSSGSMRSTLLLRKSISSSKLTFTTTSFTTSSELLGSARLCSAPTRAARSCVPTCNTSMLSEWRSSRRVSVQAWICTTAFCSRSRCSPGSGCIPEGGSSSSIAAAVVPLSSLLVLASKGLGATPGPSGQVSPKGGPGMFAATPPVLLPPAAEAGVPAAGGSGLASRLSADCSRLIWAKPSLTASGVEVSCIMVALVVLASGRCQLTPKSALKGSSSCLAWGPASQGSTAKALAWSSLTFRIA
mmetsp:Transcript_6832/g.17683  ORF Transcript_6832/g.17683 Transcript_6832/m.17683 type:complete len:280 (-) Transcript_6832:862-1701(-)